MISLAACSRFEALVADALPSEEEELPPAELLTLSSSATTHVINEGDSVIVIVTLDREAPFETEFDWSIDDTEGNFEATSGTVTIPKGTQSVSFSLRAVDNAIYDRDRDKTLTLAGSDKVFKSNVTVALNVVDDEVEPTLTLTSSDSVKLEGASFSYQFTLSHATKDTVSLDWSVGGGTASASDFKASSGTFTIAPLATTGTLTIETEGDSTSESDESFTVTFSNVANATASLSPVNGSIVDNDTPITIAINQAGGQADPTGTLPVSYTVSFSREIDPSTFSASDITQAGTATDITWDIQDSGDHINFTLQATAVTTDGTLQPQLAAEVVSTSMGLTNETSTSTDNTVTLERVAPTVAITSAASNPTSTSPIGITITFSEAVTGFVVGDLTVAGATVGNFVAVSSTQYTADLTPSSATSDITVDIAANSALDAAGNGNTAATQFAIRHDSAAPAAATALGWSQTSPTNTTSLTASWTKSASSDLNNQKIQFYSDGTCSTTTGSLTDLSSASTQTQAFTGSSGGTYTYKITSLDSAGNSTVSACSSSLSIDTTAPTGASISIAAGAAYTTNTSVTLTLAATDATQMYITNTSGCASDGSWETYATSKSWTLGTANDTNNVYVKFKDDAGNETSCVSDSILHDATGPSAPSSVTLGSVPLELTRTPFVWWATASDNAGGTGVSYYQMQVQRTSDDAVISAWATATQYTRVTGLNLTEGTQYYVRIRAVDVAGNLGSETQSANWTARLGGTVKQIVSGGSFTCALLGSGSVSCWGANASGQLGLGNTTTIGDDEHPSSASTVSLSTEARQITAGNAHACVILSNGLVSCWGSGAGGRLGYGNTNTIGDDEAPSTAGTITLGGTAKQISAGEAHTCALLDSGYVRCWGDNTYGQLGYGNVTTIGDNEAASTGGNVSLGDRAIQISAGRYHTCAVLGSGSVKCWGAGSNGRLGYGNMSNIGDDEVPSSVGTVSLGSSALEVSAGDSHTCALLSNSTVRCWGQGAGGRLGYGNTTSIGDDEAPSSAGPISFGTAVKQISAGSDHTCAVLVTGAVRCWGLGTSGRLGLSSTNNIGDDESPTTDVTVGGTVTQVESGDSHTCALLDTGRVRCWGDGTSGRLGYSNTTTIGDTETPSTAGSVSVGGSVVAIRLAARSSHSCAVLSSGAVRCWGYNASGQLGYVHTQRIGDNEVAGASGDVDVGLGVMALAMGGSHTCVLTTSGTVRCWGSGSSGRLGYGNTTTIGDNETPSSAGDVSLGGTAVGIAAGLAHTCAIISDGTVRCWGDNTYGQLGLGHTTAIGDNEVPSSVAVVNVGGVVKQLVAGDDHTCALLDNGHVRCWGRNNIGQLGYGNGFNIGDDEDPSSAGDVSLGGEAIALASGDRHNCAIMTTGAVRCWGAGSLGRLGYASGDDIGDNESPSAAGDVNISVNLIGVSLGGQSTCGLSGEGGVRCWGNGTSGQLGYANNSPVNDASTVGDVSVGEKVVYLATGDIHTCALRSTGEVNCWGGASNGQLGYGNTTMIGDDEHPSTAGILDLAP